MDEGEEQEQAAKLVAAVETGFPGDRPTQLQQLARHASRSPWGLTGVFLRAMKAVAEAAQAEI